MRLLDIAIRMIKVNPKSIRFVPNCFTPNGEGTKDAFQSIVTQMKNILVGIFNRWVELLTSWEVLDGSWNGYYQDHPCDEEVNVYQIKASGADGKSYDWIRPVSLIH